MAVGVQGRDKSRLEVHSSSSESAHAAVTTQNKRCMAVSKQGQI